MQMLCILYIYHMIVLFSPMFVAIDSSIHVVNEKLLSCLSCPARCSYLVFILVRAAFSLLVISLFLCCCCQTATLIVWITFWCISEELIPHRLFKMRVSSQLHSFIKKRSYILSNLDWRSSWSFCLGMFGICMLAIVPLLLYILNLFSVLALVLFSFCRRFGLICVSFMME